MFSFVDYEYFFSPPLSCLVSSILRTERRDRLSLEFLYTLPFLQIIRPRSVPSLTVSFPDLNPFSFVHHPLSSVHVSSPTEALSDGNAFFSGNFYVLLPLLPTLTLSTPPIKKCFRRVSSLPRQFSSSLLYRGSARDILSARSPASFCSTRSVF